MNEDDITFEQGDEERRNEAAGGSEEELEAQESRAESKIDKVKKELEACKAEKQEYLDGWQRSKADYANAVKRFDMERIGALTLGQMKAVQSFLPAMDSLSRAEAAGEIPEAFAGIAKQLHDAAKSLGLTTVGAVGEAFDPNLHEALGQDVVDSPEKDDVVTAVLETGWKTEMAVLRPAKVRVGTYSL